MSKELLSFNNIMRVVCKYYGVKKGEVLTVQRQQELVGARHMFCNMCRSYTSSTTLSIGLKKIKNMTKKEMNTLVDMIIEALVKKQKELDNEFFDKVDKRSDEGYNGMMEMEDVDDSLVDDISKKEALYIRLQNLYAIQSKILKDENYEAAAEISKTIDELKKRLNEM